MPVQDLLKGKRILVTGSSAGIGAETAKVLTEQGACVLGVDLNESFENIADSMAGTSREHSRALRLLLTRGSARN